MRFRGSYSGADKDVIHLEYDTVLSEISAGIYQCTRRCMSCRLLSAQYRTPCRMTYIFFLNFTKCHGQVSYTRGSGFRSHKASGCHDPCFAWLFVSPCSQMSGQFLKLGHVSCFHILSSLVFASRPTLYHYIKISYNFVLIFVLIN